MSGRYGAGHPENQLDFRPRTTIRSLMIRKVAFTSFLLCCALFAQSAATPSTPDKTNPSTAQSPAAKPAATGTHSPYRPDRFAGRAGEYYRLPWGVVSVSVRGAGGG